MATPAVGTVSLPIGEVLRVANEYERGGRLDDATRLLSHILRAAPDQGDALHLAGIVAFRKGDVATSLDLMERSLTHGIDTPLYLRNICEVYRAAGRLDEALDAAQRATALAPADPLCLHNQAVIHYHRVELDASLDCAGRALRIDPSLPGGHFVRAEALLLRGEWAEGWDEYEWRFRIGGAAPLMPPTSKPQWDGRALPDRTLLLVADQGFGDVIQFARYIPWAAERCPDYAIASSIEMRPLLQQIAPVRGSSFAGRMRLTMRLTVHCRACHGWRARASRPCLRRYPICAPTRHARRNGRSEWTAWCREASAASA